VTANGDDLGPGWGWAAQLLPQIEQQAIDTQIDFGIAIEDPRHASPRTAIIKVYLCPSDTVPQKIDVGSRNLTGQMSTVKCSLAPANYVGNFGVGEPGVDGEGIFFRNSQIRNRDVLDGTSSTLLAGERTFRIAAATWVGAVTNANLIPAANSSMPFEVLNASNYILSHTAENKNGPGVPAEANNFSSAHGYGVQFVFVDGHVSYLTSSISFTTLLALSTRAGQEAINESY
jgi:prepilin-type processing-associated H-X9-DG protein